MLWAISYPCSSLGRPRIPDASKMSSFYLHKSTKKLDGWEMFEEWLRELDRKYAFEERNLTLVIDNCPAHPHIDNLKAIKLYFLPPNITSKTQPMDQGVIRSLKIKIPEECCTEHY